MNVLQNMFKSFSCSKVPRKSCLHAFTLLEILVALAVLAIGILAVGSLFPAGLYSARRTADLTAAAVLGQRQVELYRSGHAFEEIEAWLAGNPPEWSYPAGGRREAFPPPDGDYSWRVVMYRPEADLRLIGMSLAVYWTDRGGEREETFTAFIIDYGG